METEKSNTGFRQVCINILSSVYDNVLEIDTEAGTMRCIKSAEDLFWFSAIPIRFFMEDALRILEENIDFKDKTILRRYTENLYNNSKTEHFSAVSKKNRNLYHGIITAYSNLCWLSFSVVSDAKSDNKNVPGNIASEKSERSLTPSVYIQTFGHFEVFSNGNPVLFRSKKAKELLAVLVDRKGGYLSSREAIKYLWKNEDVNNLTLSRLRKVAMRLLQILKDNNIEHIIESSDGNRRIVTEAVNCDLYDYLSGKISLRNISGGKYLPEYNWAISSMNNL